MMEKSINKNERDIRIRVQGILEVDDDILLVKHEKNGNEYYLLPGGGVDYGEDFKTALKREFLEESNIEVEVGDMVFVSEGIAPNGGRHIVNIYFKVSYVSGVLKLGEDEGNLVGVEFFPKDDIDNLVLYPNTKKELKEYFKSEHKTFRYLGNRWE